MYNLNETGGGGHSASFQSFQDTTMVCLVSQLILSRAPTILKREAFTRLHCAMPKVTVLFLTLIKNQAHISRSELTGDEDAGKTVLNPQAGLSSAECSAPELKCSSET